MLDIEINELYNIQERFQHILQTLQHNTDTFNDSLSTLNAYMLDSANETNLQLKTLITLTAEVLATTSQDGLKVVNAMKPIIAYLEEHHDLLDKNMNIAEMLDRIECFYAMQNETHIASSHVAILSNASYFLSSFPNIQINGPEAILCLLAIYVSILEIENSKK